MDIIAIRRALGLIGLSIFAAACGGGGGGAYSGGGSNAPTQTPVANASPGGIWRGTESVSGLQVTGLADEAGNFHFIRSDGVQYVGTGIVNGNSVTANVEGFVPLGYAFPDGSTHGTGTVSGSIQARSSLSLTTQFRTDAGNTTNGTLNLTFDTLYNRASSLTTISGNFTNPQTGVVTTVSSNGTIFSQDPSSHCIANGNVSIINASYNAYAVQFSYSSCVGQFALLNGLQLSGLATLDNASPEHVITGVTGQSGNTRVAIVYTLTRT